nr:VWA domain-containing protein [Candidatus Freyrarchaeum guaymaensis]HDO80675.1 VWA domain-containing protein [Candidatus Bathyarchaeota archaeon]
MSVKLEVVNAGAADGRAFMNKNDMNQLGVDDFDVVVFINEYEDWGAVQVMSREDCPEGYIMIDEDVLDSANVSEGDTVTVKKKKVTGGIKFVQLGVEPMEGQSTEDVVVWVADHVGELARILKKRPIYRNLELSWRDAECGHIKLRVQSTKPELYGEDVGIVDPTGHEVTFEIVPALDMTFNAILMIDVSGSMQKKDMKVKNVDGAIEGLRKGMRETPRLQEFLIGMEEGGMVSRIKAAALATLLYLSLKIGRGWGENVQVITFADQVEPLTITDQDGNTTTVIKCTGESRALGLEVIGEYILERCQEGSGLTFMSGALKTAAELAERFPPNPKTGKPNPVMFVLLSDGYPNTGDEAAGIPVNPIPVVRNYFSGRPEWVLYTIGIGEADVELMRRLAEIGRGEFFKADDFGDLTRWYDLLAQRFAISVRTTPSQFAEASEL